MKKTIVSMALLFGLLGASVAWAAPNVGESRPEPVYRGDPYKWEISVKPKPTQEQLEEARWVTLVENNVGVYGYEAQSMTYGRTKSGEWNPNEVLGLMKTVFTNKKITDKLKKDYKGKLEKGEKVSYTLVTLDFLLAEKTYRTGELQVYTNTNRMIDTKAGSEKYVAIPKGTTAEAMYEVALDFDRQMRAEADRLMQEEEAREAAEQQGATGEAGQ